MAQHDYNIANQSGAAFRADLNNALLAIVSQNSGTSAPSTTFAHQLWADTTTSTLKIRNAANSAWIELMQLDGTLTMEDGTALLPGLAFRDDLNTGLFSDAADTLGIATNGVERVEFGTTAVVFNDGGNDVDFRIEGDTNANLFFVDAGNDRIGIGNSSPSTDLHVSKAASAEIRVSGTANGSDAAIGLFGTQSGGGSRDISLKYDNSSDTYKLITTTANHITIDNSSGEVMRIDGSGNVGIGTASPAFTNGDGLEIARSGTACLRVEGDSGNKAAEIYVDSTGTTIDSRGTSARTNFAIGGNSKMLLDNSGRLLVGTSTGTSAQAIITNGLQVTGAAADGNTNRATLDYSGSTGRLMSHFSTGSELAFFTNASGSGVNERMRIDSTGLLVKYGDSNTARIIPQTDNAGYIGESSHRWQAIYAVNGTIQTSDEREKTEIIDSPLGTDFIKSLRPVAYKWKVGGYEHSVDEEGEDVFTPVAGQRTHYGFIAQEVRQAAGDADFGGWLLEDLSDPDSKQSLRLHEFISPMVKALQEAMERIETLEAKVAALEAN